MDVKIAMATSRQYRYGIVAVAAANIAAQGVDPVLSWDDALITLFSDRPSSKPCARSTYLSLADAGLIKNVARGRYTSSVKNREHAEDALRLLRQDDSWGDSPLALWQRVIGVNQIKEHNGQMHVVIGLWRAKKFVGQDS
jgi:hypothetical protein